MVDSFLNPLDTAPRVNPQRDSFDKKPSISENGNSNFKNILVEKFNQETSPVADARPVSPPITSIQPSLFKTGAEEKRPSTPTTSDYSVADPSEAISSSEAVIDAKPTKESNPAPQKPAPPKNLAEMLNMESPEIPDATPEIKPERRIDAAPAPVAKPERKIVAPQPKPVEAQNQIIETPAPVQPAKKKSESRPVAPTEAVSHGNKSGKNYTYAVRPGDTLSHVVTMALRDTGRSYSTSDIYSWVQVIARANGILNPNRIYNGQQVDLSPIYTGDNKIETKPANTMAINKEIQVPLNGRVTSRFGMRDHPILDKEELHSGIDISSPIGSGIHPMLSGMIVFSGEMGGYGKMVEVDHGNGLRTRYGHLSENFVKVGDYVTANQVLGLSGQTGLATGPHLHFEIRQGGQPIDPLSVLSEQAIESRSNAVEIS